MKTLARAALWLSALCMCAPAMAQASHATESFAPAGRAPEYAPITVAARSIAATGSVTSSGVTSTAAAGAAAPTFASGTATIPFAAQLGYPVRVILKLAADTTLTASVGTSVDGCATVNTLTAGGSPVTYSAAINEYVDVPVTTDSALTYCLVATVTAGTLTYAVRQ